MGKRKKNEISFWLWGRSPKERRTEPRCAFSSRAVINTGRSHRIAAQQVVRAAISGVLLFFFLSKKFSSTSAASPRSAREEEREAALGGACAGVSEAVGHLGRTHLELETEWQFPHTPRACCCVYVLFRRSQWSVGHRVVIIVVASGRARSGQLDTARCSLRERAPRFLSKSKWGKSILDGVLK